MSNSLPITIFLIEDEPSLALTYEGYLRRASYAVSAFHNGRDAIACLKQFRPNAIVLDLHLPDMNGLEILRYAQSIYPGLPVIVITVDSSPQAAIDAMHDGAADFILKPFPSARLTLTLKHVLERQALEHEVNEWRQALGQNRYHGFVGQSAAMQAVYRIIESVAASKASVFITGESGTGKELAAQALHDASPRRSKPIIAINCGAIPRDLLESTLFGHIKGAFTGAVNDSIGAAKAADGGSLFLDEVGELPLELQVKLLRFLQTSEVVAVGSNKVEKVDVRIIAATNRNPLVEVKAGRLREDLYYRLHVVPLELPALRERNDDIILLAKYFIEKFSREEGKEFTTLSPETVTLLRQYDWPGNVRQLENAIHSAIILNKGAELTPEMLPLDMENTTISTHTIASIIATNPTIKPLWQTEKEAIMHALSFTKEDVAKAAALLEVSPSTLYRKLQSWRDDKI